MKRVAGDASNHLLLPQTQYLVQVEGGRTDEPNGSYLLVFPVRVCSPGIYYQP